jgi:hypothetical protein
VWHATFDRKMTFTPHLYKIPITSVSDPSRKPIRGVALFECQARILASRFDLGQSGAVLAQLCCVWRIRRRKEPHMLDVILLALGLAFFAVSVGYTVACDRL